MPDDHEKDCFPPSVRINSFFHSSIFPGHPLCVHITFDGSPQCLPFTTSKPSLRLLPSGNVPSRIYATNFLYYHEFNSVLHTMVGSTPSNVFVTRPKLYAHRASPYTRDLDAAGYDLLQGLALACNFEIYRYSLPPAHMPFLFSCIYTISSPWPRTSPHEVNHHYIYSIPIYNSFYIPPVLFLSNF